MKYLVSVRSDEDMESTWALVVEADTADKAVQTSIDYLVKEAFDDYADSCRTWEFHAYPLNAIRDGGDVLYSAQCCEAEQTVTP